MQSAGNRRFDVAIIGGGVVGCSVAYFVKKLAPSVIVGVIEPDPTYEFASTLRASGGCRVQFTTTENIEMSLFSLDFIRTFPQEMAIKGEPAPIDWVEGGYLFVVPPESARQLEENARKQVAWGCTVNLLGPRELKQRWPSMNVDDLGVGAHTPHDGWCDPNALLWGFRRKAASLGVEFLKARVTGMKKTSSKVASVTLDDGTEVVADSFVNAAGAWSGQVAQLAGMTLPVTPMKRYEHYFTAGSPMEPQPYATIDLTRLGYERVEANAPYAETGIL